MLFLKTYFRHLSKHKLYTLVTIVGFGISLAFVILLSVYIKNELAVDDFQVNKERIYRLESSSATDFSGPIAVDLKNTYPDIEDYTRVYSQTGIATLTNDEKFAVQFLAVDPSFFSIFSYSLQTGVSSEVLVSPNSIVISESYTRKLFGNKPAIGERIFINTTNEFVVSGVMKDFPEKTVFKQPDVIVNIEAMKKITGWEQFLTEYGFCSMNIFFLEKENGNVSAKAPEILSNFKENFWLYKEGYADGVVFTPLKDIYFSSKTGNFVKSNDKNLIVILSVIVLLILILAIGNYINLTVAQASFRAKEIAIKKLVGSPRKALFQQLIKESILLCTVSVVFAIFLAKLVEPVFNSLLDTKLDLNNSLSFINLLLFLLLLSGIAIFSGIIPALRITRFKPVDIVKGSFRKTSKSNYSKVFITFQYTITIALLVCSLIIIKQTNFLRNYDVGFSRENILHLPYLTDFKKKESVRNTLQQIPGVSEISFTWGSPLDGGSNQSFDYNDKPVSFQEFSVDSTFFSVFNIEINRTKAAYSKKGIFLNKKALKVLEMDNAPTSLKVYDNSYPVLGVVKDFNFNDLKKNIGPIMIHQGDAESYVSNIFIKVNNVNMSEAINKIKSEYASMVDHAPFDVTFVDEAINKWYLKEEKTGKIISYFTLLSFIISFMGILAMATFYMQQHKKEISIRKVNGASILQIFSQLNKNFLKWIGLAFLISVPVSWYFMHRWLENFAYKTTLNWWVFVSAGLLTLMVAFISISWQSFKAAVTNPVEALKDE